MDITKEYFEMDKIPATTIDRAFEMANNNWNLENRLVVYYNGLGWIVEKVIDYPSAHKIRTENKHCYIFNTSEIAKSYSKYKEKPDLFRLSIETELLLFEKELQLESEIGLSSSNTPEQLEELINTRNFFGVYSGIYHVPDTWKESL